jgi:hypothetical protein
MRSRVRSFSHRGKSVIGGLALAAAVAVVPVASASAASFPNACKNNVSANHSQIGVDMSADSSATVAPGDSFTLSNIQQTANVPGGIFLVGYNLNLLTVGENTIPADVVSTIEGSNTVEGTQVTNTVSSSITTTITDPDGIEHNGDELATDGALSVTYADQTWTAGPSAGSIDFREDTVPIGAGADDLHTGGLKITAAIPTPNPDVSIIVRFGCSPGTVSGPDPGVVALDDPATSFASTTVINEISFGKAKLNKKKGTAKLPVNVSGAGDLVLKKTSTVKGAEASTDDAGTVKLNVKPLGKAKKNLKKKGKATVKVSVTFTGNEGDPVTETAKLNLKKK